MVLGNHLQKTKKEQENLKKHEIDHKFIKMR